MGKALMVLTGILLKLAMLWGCAAIWFDSPWQGTVAGVICATYALIFIATAIRVRPYAKALTAQAALVALTIAWWLAIPPSNERQWLPDVAKPPTFELEGSTLTVNNLRNFKYSSETEFKENWERRTYNLEELTGLDLFLCYWGPRNIAHTIMSWQFADGTNLAVSIETRKEMGEEYSAVRGFFRQFEVYYVVADERDLVGLRTNHRGEQVYLYPLKSSKEEARLLLADYVKRANKLAKNPRWYNALSHNCTTAIRQHAKQVGIAAAPDWRLIANGHLDELAYERNQISRELPFDELRKKSEITDKAKRVGITPEFSKAIREGLPGSR